MIIVSLVVCYFSQKYWCRCEHLIIWILLQKQRFPKENLKVEFYDNQAKIEFLSGEIFLAAVWNCSWCITVVIHLRIILLTRCTLTDTLRVMLLKKMT